MALLTKDTSVRLSLATMFAVLLWMGGASWKVFGYVQMISANSVAIQNIDKSIKLGRIDDEIRELKAEIRQINREQQRFPDEDILLEQKEDLEDDIEHLERVRECVARGEEICE